MLIEFCCLIPPRDTHSPNLALVHWCSVHVLLPRARVNPRTHCSWYCGWECQGQFVAILLPTGSLDTSGHSLASQNVWCPPASPCNETPAVVPCLPHCVSCEQGSLPMVWEAVFCMMRKGLDHFVFINFIQIFVHFFFPREAYFHVYDLCHM